MHAPQYKIQEKVEVVDESATIGDAVARMNAKNISSLLVANAKGMIVGILTERDVLRRLTLLDVADKLARPVGTIATREVFFADARHLHASIVKLHFEKHLRHFPVLKGADATVDNLAGMLTVTDILRHYLRDEAERAAEASATKALPLPKRVAVLTYKPAGFSVYKKSLSGPTIKPLPLEDFFGFFKTQAKGEMPLIVDMDGWPTKKLSSIIVQAKKYRGQLILSVSNPDVVTLFRKYLASGRQTIVAKPFDPDYLIWLLTAVER